MRVLYLTDREDQRLKAALNARGSSVLSLSALTATSSVRSFAGSVKADLIIIDFHVWDLMGDVAPSDPLAAMAVALDVRSLPDYVAMDDGRKWSQLPIVIRQQGSFYVRPRFDNEDRHLLHVMFNSDLGEAYRVMRGLVWDYYKNVANDFDNVGYLVEERQNRLRVEVALRRRRSANTTYYYGPADRRRNSIFTLARDMSGDVADLIDPRRRSTEHSLHHFLADASNYLTVEDHVISHPRIGEGKGRSEFDFVLRPLDNPDAREAWSLLEIKRADQPILVGLDTQDPRLAAAMFRFGKQVQRYNDLINDPRSRDKVLEALGGLPKDAKLALLVGRRPLGDPLDIRAAFQKVYPIINLVTYDDLYDAREAALRIY